MNKLLLGIGQLMKGNICYYFDCKIVMRITGWYSKSQNYINQTGFCTSIFPLCILFCKQISYFCLTEVQSWLSPQDDLSSQELIIIIVIWMSQK